MESGGDPTAAIEKLRDRNLGLQEERGNLLQQLGLPADYLTDKPLCPKCGDTGYAGSATCECVKARYAKLLKGHLHKDQIVVTYPGAFSALVMKNIFGDDPDCPIFADATTCRMTPV